MQPETFHFFYNNWLILQKMWYFVSFDGNQLHITVQIFAQNTILMYIIQLDK